MNATWKASAWNPVPRKWARVASRTRPITRLSSVRSPTHAALP